MTHSKCFLPCGHVLLPSGAESIGQVAYEVENPGTGCGQVGLGEKHTEHEALGDGGDGENQQEEENDTPIRVFQDFAKLKRWQQQ